MPRWLRAAPETTDELREDRQLYSPASVTQQPGNQSVAWLALKRSHFKVAVTLLKFKVHLQNMNTVNLKISFYHFFLLFALKHGKHLGNVSV